MPARGSGYQTKRGRPARMGRPPGKKKKEIGISPKQAAAVNLQAIGLKPAEIMEKLNIPSIKTTYALLMRGKRRYKELGLKDPVQLARDTLAEDLVPKAMQAYDDALTNKKQPALRLIAATNTLKGAQVFVGKSETETTKTQIKNNIETKRIEIAFEKKLIDKFNLDIEPAQAEVLTQELTGDVV
jgi:hypothetical protein